MVLVLETRFPELEDCWEMVVEKGKQWIEDNHSSSAEAVKQKIRTVLNKD